MKMANIIVKTFAKIFFIDKLTQRALPEVVRPLLEETKFLIILFLILSICTEMGQVSWIKMKMEQQSFTGQ